MIKEKTKRSQEFLYNAWYVAGWSAELAAGARLGRRLLDEPVVLFRSMSGMLGALEDCCCHRAMQLSHGEVVGETIRCSYHGLEFGVDGVCTRIPSQDKIPSSARVRRYPVTESDEFIWIWMGDPELADTVNVPRHLTHSDPDYAWRNAHYSVQGNWQLLVDNLMDLSHLPFIHPHTIGGDPDLHFKTKTESARLPDGVRVQRHMPASVPPPTYVAAKGFAGLVDRWQEVEFHPVYIKIHTGGCDAGTGAYEGQRRHGLSMIGFHGITPETAGTTHYFWSIATNAKDNGIPDLVFQQTAATFREDQAVLELQQQRIAGEPDRHMLDIASDVGGRQARLLLGRLIQAERGGETEEAA